MRAEEAGADLITLHLREDRRHIQDHDLLTLLGVARRVRGIEAREWQEFRTRDVLASKLVGFAHIDQHCLARSQPLLDLSRPGFHECRGDRGFRC